MDLISGLERIRSRLEANRARPETLDVVDEYLEKARRAPGGQAAARSLGQIVGLLMRTPAAHGSTVIYDDLTRLEGELADATAQVRAEREALESRPMPKPTKYYKEMKKKQREAEGKGKA